MKRAGTITICLTVGLAFSGGLRADDIANPYAQVVARNIFGLNPPVAADQDSTPVEPPVKITPNGIMSIFGQLQVLFKVAGKTPGKEDSYILSEGQRQDDIEVTKIDEKNSVVTFNNHGLVQILPLTAAAAVSPANSSIPAPMLNGRNPAMPGMPLGRNFGGSGFNNAFGGRAVNGGNNPGINNSQNNSPASGNAPTSVGFHVDGPPVDPAAQTVMIEVQRAQYKSVGDPTAQILPPTELTPPPDNDTQTPAPGQ
jgi:hypothetical protein